MTQERIAVTHNVVRLSFTLANIQASQDDTAVPRDANGDIYEALWDGYILGMVVQLSAAKTGGTLEFNPAIAGSSHAEGVTVGATNTEWTATWEAHAVPFNAGDSLGVNYTSNGSFTPTTADVNVDLYVMFENMNVYGA